MTEGNKKHKALIVGGGFGGVKTALELAHDHRFDITLISDQQDFRYYPSLYHTATGGSKDESDIPLSEIFSEVPAVNIVHDTAKSIDREGKFVMGGSGKKYEYDLVVFALGMVTNYFGIPGLDKFAYGIKSLEDAEKLKQHMHKHIVETKHTDLNYVVVGAGPTGVELAGVLGDYINRICKKHGAEKRSVHVDLVEAADRVLPRSSKRVSKKVHRQLKRKGVKIYLKAVVQSENEEELLVNGKPVRSHTVIWTAGMANNPFFTAQNFQLAKNHKVRVDQFLQAEPSIYVIGDNADTAYSGMAQTALYDGVYIAHNMKRLADHLPPLPYEAKQPIYVIPAGPHWAAVEWGRMKFYGIIGWTLRRAADFIAYRDYEPFFKATKHWMSEYKKDDLCEICKEE
ncbi:MAG TPA: FAD-dependent oxidoreductase [Candidatus Saccharimonadales bacterium]|nr:FAD-dependent oxidoreductase [Candidatus Saccharimonadales bacterium]